MRWNTLILSAKLTDHLEGGVLCSTAGASLSGLLTNISEKKNTEQSQRDVKDVQEARDEEEEEAASAAHSVWKPLATRAANKFITQQGCLVLTLILGPEQWVMNIFFDKWRRLSSEAVVGAYLHSPDHLDNTWCQGRRGRNVSSIPSDVLHDSAVTFLLSWSSGPCLITSAPGIIIVVKAADSPRSKNKPACTIVSL